MKLCMTSDCCRLLCRIVSPTQTVPFQSSAVIGKNEDGSDITQDVDVLVWWRDVGQARFPRIAVMDHQFLVIPPASATAERVFSFAGLTTCSNLCLKVR
jgi:hypothetical protein